MALGKSASIFKARRMFGPRVRIERAKVKETGTWVWTLIAPLLDGDKPVKDAEGRDAWVALGAGVTFEHMFADAVGRVNAARAKFEAEQAQAAAANDAPIDPAAPVEPRE